MLMPITHNSLLLIARLLFSMIFLFAGIGKIIDFNGTVVYMQSAGITFFPAWLAMLAIIFEVGGGLAVLLGWHARLGAAALFVFTGLVTFAIHHFWSYSADASQLQMILFMKNISMMGGALYIFCFGAGAYSIDAKYNRSGII